jgi:ubiquinone/menaquinone biosynthesis C-methylase UbiE
MPELDEVVEHYTHGKLLDAIRAKVLEMGLKPESVRVEDLAPVDEFHIGGRQASEDFISQLGLRGSDHVLDIGCGLGGTARFTVQRDGCRVTGIDPTREFIETGRALTEWVGLEDRVALRVANALELPLETGVFDAAYMVHVGMNIQDKAKLCQEVGRVLKPGASFGIYDIMRTSDEPLQYPVPWATKADICSLGTPEQYRQALAAAGLSVTAERDRHEFAVNFFDQLRKQTEAPDRAPALGLQIVMGDQAPLKIRNMIENVAAGRVSPVEMIAVKPQR